MTRTSVREYQDLSVEKEKIDLILRTGMAAQQGVKTNF